MKKRAALSMLIVAAGVTWLQLDSTHNLPKAAEFTQPEQREFISSASTSTSLNIKATLKPTHDARIDATSSDKQSQTQADSTSITEASLTETDAEAFDYLPATKTLIGTKGNADLAATGNQPPFIVESVYQQLTQQVANWTIREGQPMRLQLNVANLFDDPDNDLLTTRVELNLNGGKVSGGQTLTIYGTPKVTHLPSLTISAKDSYHDVDAWVSARFSLPLSELGESLAHPLEGDVIYRLETSNELNGQYTLYEVVYCQAFKFSQQEVYFASSDNKTHCPKETQLNKIGSYHIEGDKLIVASQLSSLDANQIWQVKHQYPSKQTPDVTNYFVAVDNGNHYESYTMQKQASEMEKRLNAVTGEVQFQITMFDYLLPLPDDQYLPIEVGNYLFDLGHSNAGPNNETLDSDLNIVAGTTNLSCATIAQWYQMDVVGGQGEYGIELISTSDRSNPAYRVECIEFISNPNSQRVSLAFDGAYSPYDKFVDGEIYSYILRPKPQYAQRVEELKINMHYRSPR